MNEIILEPNGCASIVHPNGQQNRIGIAWEYNFSTHLSRVFGDPILIVSLSLHTLQQLVNEYLQPIINPDK